MKVKIKAIGEIKNVIGYIFYKFFLSGDSLYVFPHYNLTASNPGK